MTHRAHYYAISIKGSLSQEDEEWGRPRVSLQLLLCWDLEELAVGHCDPPECPSVPSEVIAQPWAMRSRVYGS